MSDEYPIELTGPKHDITIVDEYTAQIGCNEYHIPDLFYFKAGLLLTGMAVEEAENYGYDTIERQRIVAQFQTLYEQGLVEVEEPGPEYEEGAVEHGPGWTTNPEAIVREGDIVVHSFDSHIVGGWLHAPSKNEGKTNTNLTTRIITEKRDGMKLSDVCSVEDDNNLILFKTSEKRDSSFHEEASGEEDSMEESELPDWVVEDREYRLPDGGKGVPVDYRPVENGEYFVGDSSPETMLQNYALVDSGYQWASWREEPRIILEPQYNNVDPSYWWDLGIEPDRTWNGRYELADEMPRVPEDDEPFLGWGPRSGWQHDFGATRGGPSFEHPELGKKRPILKEIE